MVPIFGPPCMYFAYLKIKLQLQLTLVWLAWPSFSRSVIINDESMAHQRLMEPLTAVLLLVN